MAAESHSASFSDSARDGSAGSGATFNPIGPRSVKRPRPVKSCLECRRRKMKCDRLLPCSQCQKSLRSCRYAPDGETASQSDGSDADTPGRTPKRIHLSANPETGHRYVHDSPHATSSVLDDHGSRIERLEKLLLAKSPSVTEAGSNHAPRRPTASALTIRGLTVKGGLRTRFFGQNSTRVLVNLFDEAKEYMFGRDKSSDILELFNNLQKVHKALQEEHRKAIDPIAVFVDSMTPIQKRMADILPSKAVCDHLLEVYLTASETIYRILHIPSFRIQYNNYWEGSPQGDAFLPQLLSVICVAYRFANFGMSLYHDREGIHISTACALVRAWLDGLRGKQLVEFSTLQAEVLQLMAQRMINPNPQEFWTHLGLVVRMAMTMGLHRDPAEFAHKISPFWAEQRRKVWHTILELDVYMSMQCNLPSCIREGDWTCLPPRNLSDDDLYPTIDHLPTAKPIEQDTNTRIQAFAASTLCSRSKVVDFINRADSLEDYQQILDLGNDLERVFEDIRCIVPPIHSSDMKTVRRQWSTRVIMDMNCRRPLLALYRPFALSSPDAPQQVMTGYLRSAMILLGYLDELDPNSPDYQSIWHLHHLVLEHDITQAAFSVCYYIKQITNASSSSPSSSTMGSGTISDSVEESCKLASESSRLLHLPRLRAAVEKVLDTQIKRIGELGTDMKDLVSLMIVFYTYKAGTPHQKQEAIKRGMQRVLDAGLQAIHSSQENLASMPLMPTPAPMQMGGSSQTDPGVMGQMHQPFMMTPDVPNIIPDDFAIWDMEFWNPLLYTGPS